MKFKKVLIYLLFLTAISLASPLSPVQAATCTLPDPPTLAGFACVFGNIVGSLAALGGIAAFLIIIVGAFKYMSSSGDPKAAAAAKQTITWGVFGFLLILGSYFVLTTIHTYTKVDVLKFEIPDPSP